MKILCGKLKMHFHEHQQTTECAYQLNVDTDNKVMVSCDANHSKCLFHFCRKTIYRTYVNRQFDGFLCELVWHGIGTHVDAVASVLCQLQLERWIVITMWSSLCSLIDFTLQNGLAPVLIHAFVRKWLRFGLVVSRVKILVAQMFFAKEMKPGLKAAQH